MAQRIVAELGRPETPDETAARKAETSRAHRASQTVRNLVWSLGASLGVVLLVVLVVVRPDPAPAELIDYGVVASEAQQSVDATLAAPVLPSGWTANAAELRADGDIQIWYVGFITPEQQFIALNQGIDANPTWVDNLLDGARTSSTVSIDGVAWSVYDDRDSANPGNLAYAMTASERGSTYVLFGTANDAEFETLATAMGIRE